MQPAGEPGDRWPSVARRKAGGKSGHRPESSGARATRLVTPGERTRHAGFGLRNATSFTESATENRPPRNGTVASRRKTCKMSSHDSLVRVKRWGKSPPLTRQRVRHGKPRVVQGQIGGESRPGSSSQRSRNLPPHRGGCDGCAPFAAAQAVAKSNPRVGCWSHGASHGLEE
jgi:hypothetical protein